MRNTHKIAKVLGISSEIQAKKYLTKNGLRFLTANYTCRLGEIDLIMLDDMVLVFIEVRARQNNSHGTAIETVNRAKQRRIIHTAQHFLQKTTELNYEAIRFDVIGIQNKNITWVQNAFILDD